MPITRIPKSRLLTLFALLVSLGLTAYASTRQPASDEPTTAATQEKPKAGPSSTADGDYVGSETCITCHQDQDRRFKNTIMGKAMAHPHSPEEARGCESCHGPGRAHVEAGGGKDTIPIRLSLIHI